MLSDIGFGEIIVILVVALIVVGPERLPSLSKTIGRTVGNCRRTVSHMVSELDDGAPTHAPQQPSTTDPKKQGGAACDDSPALTDSPLGNVGEAQSKGHADEC